jgi:anti-anti-sigma factor
VTHQPNEHGVAAWGTAWYRLDYEPGCVAVTAAGEIDVRSLVGLDRALTAAFKSSSRVVVDLSRVSFIDSSGLGALIGARNRARELGGSVSLVGPPPAVTRILTGTHLHEAFPIFQSLDQALAVAQIPAQADVGTGGLNR